MATFEIKLRTILGAKDGERTEDAARRVAASPPPPPPAGPRAGEALRAAMKSTDEAVELVTNDGEWPSPEYENGPQARRAGAMQESVKLLCGVVREILNAMDLPPAARPTVTPAPAPQHCTATDHTIACVEVAKASQAAGEGAECIEEGAPQPVSGEVAEWRVFFDTLNRRAVTPAEIVFARAHVERLAREVDRQRRIRASIEESRNKIRAEGIRNYERVVGQSDTLRARVAELTDEWHAAVREAGIAKARVAELEARAATLDARLLDAVESVPTSVPPARELTEAEIDRCSAAACMALNPDVGGRKPCEECFDAGRSYVKTGSPPFRDANWRAAFDRAAAAIRAGKVE